MKTLYKMQFQQAIAPLKEKLVHLYELPLSIDLLEIDDSIFQVGVSEREKYFINFSPAHYVTSTKQIYVD